MRTKRLPWLTALAFLGSTSAATVYAQQPAPKPDPDAAALATEAYIFGYPLVTMFVTERVLTNVATPQKNGKAPINQFGNLFEYPTPAFKDVTAPNVNTLYSNAWLDLTKEPIVVHMPDTQGRYYVMEILDYWTNVIGSPGKRTTGTKAQDIAMVGPNWKGELPKGLEHAYRSPTNTVWIINRIQANGPRDYAIVNALQRGIKSMPLSEYGKSFTWGAGKVDASIDLTTPVKTQVNNMPAEEYFGILAKTMKVNQAVAADSAVVTRMARIGIRAGQEFDMSRMEPSMVRDIRAGARAGLEQIENYSKTVGTIENGWQYMTICGKYGTSYLTRAAVTLVGLGCNLPEDAIYPTTTIDGHGQPLTGASHYVLHFPAGQTPPANAFWSVTMYDSDFFLVENAIKRSAISSWNDLKKNADGSLDIYIQQESPGGTKQSNWLPAPAGNFALMMRLYWPKESAINGTWKPPAVTVVH